MIVEAKARSSDLRGRGRGPDRPRLSSHHLQRRVLEPSVPLLAVGHQTNHLLASLCITTIITAAQTHVNLVAMSQAIYTDFDDTPTNLAKPRTAATLTLRVIKSFEFRTEKSLVLHGVNLETETVGGLKERARQGACPA